MPKSDLRSPSDKEIRQALLDDAKEFERVTGMARSTIGLKALNDTNFLFRLANGEDFTIRNYRRLREFMKRNRPRDTVPATK